MLATGEARFNRFHFRIVAAGTGGQFADGFSLGVIGIALSMASGPLALDSWWQGALGSASLIGLFAGSLIAGPVADRIGRRPIFAWDMAFFAAVAVAQFFIAAPWQLLILRLILGVALGADYVASKSLVTEYSPKKIRGRLLSVLAVAWAAGYVCSYVIGYLFRDAGADGWRWILLTSAIPSAIVFWFRVTIPESLQYLVRRGRHVEARAIVDRIFGTEFALPTMPAGLRDDSRAPRLLGPDLRTNLFVGCIFYTGQVIPFFAMGTYLTSILSGLGIADKYTAGLIFNLLLMLGAIAGMLVVDRLSRRLFLVGSFAAMAILLTALLLLPGHVPLLTISLFAAFAFVLAASANLDFVYPPELFPTVVRATGVGLVVACSRLGSAFSTFLLPTLVDRHGVASALWSCVAVLAAAAIVCQIWAPETRHADL